MARILIAEHNEATATYLVNTLKKAGNSVELVDNCLDAWRISSRDMFDVLLVNVVMPGIDGFVLAQKALQDNPSLQVIFITGFAGVAMDTHATPVYAPAPVTTRPFHLKEVAGRVRYMMGQGSLPAAEEHGADEGNIIYADFAKKTVNRHA
ncbi:MAG: response regulator [Alphaproteobacteria bacterium]|nr:response regulator [Alphaproteobacteria bacterium]